MTPTDEPDPSTPLQLATAARVSCTLLEEDIADQIRKPTALRARRLTDRCRQLWQRIDALAARIEDQQAEIERLTLLLSPRVQVADTAGVDFKETMREFCKGPLALPFELVPIPDLPAPDFVAEQIPDHPPITTPRCCNASPLPDLGVRPPGFQEVRRRMQRHGRRTDAIDRIKAARGEGEPVVRKGRSNSREWKIGRQARPWERFVKAVEEGRLPVGEEIPVSKLIEEAEITQATMQLIQGDLVIEAAPYRIKRNGPRGITIVRAI